jgi:hypothetical protein
MMKDFVLTILIICSIKLIYIHYCHAIHDFDVNLAKKIV